MVVAVTDAHVHECLRQRSEVGALSRGAKRGPGSEWHVYVGYVAKAVASTMIGPCNPHVYRHPDGTAYTEGLQQGPDPRYLQAVVTLKHWDACAWLRERHTLPP